MHGFIATRRQATEDDEMNDFEGSTARRLQELEKRCADLESQVASLTQPGSHDRRIAELEARATSLARAFTQRRYQLRRSRVRPPLWTFEQYLPRKLQVSPAYLRERLPADPPSIVVVTPTYNHAQYLGATIESVLSQNYPRLRYHVQDGGSQDNTSQILKSFGSRLTWASGQDGGQSQAINRGFAAAGDGEIMAFLNSDDTLLPGTLAFVARAFADRPDIDLVYGHRIFVDREGDEVGRAVLPRHDAKTLCWADYVPQETLFWRRRVWDKIGPIDESFHYALDWDFILRAQAAGLKFERLPRFLACFRVHDEQKTAAMYDIGYSEMQRLRRRYLDFEPTTAQIYTAIAPYLSRQLAFHWMYRLGLLRY
jgi:GT2 family glycosyltransferase